jgi:hypothetical protein
MERRYAARFVGAPERGANVATVQSVATLKPPGIEVVSVRARAG